MTENKNYLHKYAMQFGTYMGIFWILKFVLFPLGMTIPFLQLLFVVLTIAVPFLGFYYVRMFRDKVFGTYINYLQAWVFTVFMYMFASLLVAVAHYFYFQFIDQGYILEKYYEILRDPSVTSVEGARAYLKQLEQSLDIIANLTPFEMTMQILSLDVIFGSLLAFPTALFVMRKKNHFLR